MKPNTIFHEPSSECALAGLGVIDKTPAGSATGQLNNSWLGSHRAEVVPPLLVSQCDVIHHTIKSEKPVYAVTLKRAENVVCSMVSLRSFDGGSLFLGGWICSVKHLCRRRSGIC